MREIPDYLSNTIPEGVNKPKTHTTVTKKAFFLNLDELSNQEIVEKGIATGLIQNGQPAADVAKKLTSYDPVLGDFMAKVIQQNTKRKRGGTKKNAYMTGKNPITGEYIKNANEYLKVMSEYIMEKVNSMDGREGHHERSEKIATLFGIQKATTAALIAVFSGTNEENDVST